MGILLLVPAHLGFIYFNTRLKEFNYVWGSSIAPQGAAGTFGKHEPTFFVSLSHT